MTSQAALGRVLRPGASMPAIAMAISRCAMSVSMITDPCRHGRAAASRAALTAATTSMKAASRSKIQVGVIGPGSPSASADRADTAPVLADAARSGQ